MAAQLPPAFVACCARSGSTLLRFLVDAHPDLSCPGESDLAVLVSSYASVATGLLGGAAAAGDAHRRARAVADELVAAHLTVTGTSGWCDKSLSNVFHLDLLAGLWPEARFVMLHRHAMDMVMSGLDASPWGLAEYGFAQVAQRSPTDSVVALAAHWVDRTARMVDFEARHPGRCLRIRYEDLVADTAAVLEGLWDHLGVDRPPETPPDGFTAGRSGEGPGDHTIWYTEGVHGDAVGRGGRVPPDHVAGPLRTSVNDLLVHLGYEPVDDAWGAGGPLPGHDDGPVDDGLVEVRVVEGHAVRARRLVAVPAGTAVEEGVGRRAAAVVAVERSVLGALRDGIANLGAVLRSRHVRYYGAPLAGFDDERRVLGAVGTHLRTGPALDAGAVPSLLR